jgi:hypothetical protein
MIFDLLSGVLLSVAAAGELPCVAAKERVARCYSFRPRGQDHGRGKKIRHDAESLSKQAVLRIGELLREMAERGERKEPARAAKHRPRPLPMRQRRGIPRKVALSTRS